MALASERSSGLVKQILQPTSPKVSFKPTPNGKVTSPDFGGIIIIIIILVILPARPHPA